MPRSQPAFPCPHRPLRRRGFPPSPGTPFGAVLALIVLLAAPALHRAEENGKPPQPDPDLVRSINDIREAFRTRQTAPLTALLPTSGKVFLAVKAITAETGFYSRDQIEALLRKAFLSFQTVQFDINMNLREAGGRTDPGMISCPAAWSYIDKGASTDLNLRFLLVRQKDHWTLSEIREAR